jgi:hypothetical protein
LVVLGSVAITQERLEQGRRQKPAGNAVDLGPARTGESPSHIRSLTGGASPGGFGERRASGGLRRYATGAVRKWPQRFNLRWAGARLARRAAEFLAAAGDNGGMPGLLSCRQLAVRRASPTRVSRLMEACHVVLSTKIQKISCKRRRRQKHRDASCKRCHQHREN